MIGDTAARVGMIAADVVIVLVTIWYTYGTFKLGRQANIQTSFSTALLRAGKVVLSGAISLALNDLSLRNRCCLFLVSESTIGLSSAIKIRIDVRIIDSVMLIMNAVEFVINLTGVSALPHDPGFSQLKNDRLSTILALYQRCAS